MFRNSIHAILGLALAGSLMLATAAQAEGVYKFVDKQGRVHFADRPQPGWKRIDVPPATSPGDPTATGEVQTETARRAAECKTRKKQLADYQNSTRLVETDALGRPREYSAEEKAKLIDLTNKQIAEVCSPATPAPETAEAPAEPAAETPVETPAEPPAETPNS